MCGNLENVISSFLISSTTYTLTPGPIDSFECPPSTALTAGVWPPQWSQDRRLKHENDMIQRNLGHMWPRVSRNDHSLGRWLSGKRCLPLTPVTSVWPLGPREGQEKGTRAICPLTSSLHHAHPRHHHHPNFGKRVCAIFKDGIDHSHGIVPLHRRRLQRHWLREPVSYLVSSPVIQFPGKKSQLNYLLYLELNASPIIWSQSSLRQSWSPHKSKFICEL